jgi:hypothetical protein
MKIIITEKQELTLDFFINQQKNVFKEDSYILEWSLKNHLDNHNMMKDVINYDEDGAVDRIIDRVYGDWLYKSNYQGYDGINKEILKDMYSDRIRRKYRFLRKKNKHIVDAFENRLK